MRNFDTYTHIKELEKAGFNEEQAAVIIKSLVESRDTDISHLATKSQVSALESSVQKQFAEVKDSTNKQFAEVQKQFVEVKDSTNKQFAEVQKQFAEVQKQFAEVKDSANKQFSELNKQMLELHASTLKWMIGTMIAFAGIILAGIKLL